MAKPTYEELEQEIVKLNKNVDTIYRQFNDAMLVKELIIAAGLLSEDKFKQAEELINLDD